MLGNLTHTQVGGYKMCGNWNVKDIVSIILMFALFLLQKVLQGTTLKALLHILHKCGQSCSSTFITSHKYVPITWRLAKSAMIILMPYGTPSHYKKFTKMPYVLGEEKCEIKANPFERTTCTCFTNQCWWRSQYFGLNLQQFLWYISV